MSRGKSTCKVLKEVRREIARVNGIPLEERECTHKGDCAGTCPYCEAEVRYLERELSKRKSLGKAVAVAGIALSAVTMAGCATSEPVSTNSDNNPPKTSGRPITDALTTMGGVTNETPIKGNKVKPNKKVTKCDTYQMQGIVPESDTNSTASSKSEILPPDTMDEPPLLGMAVQFINSDLYWQFPSSYGSLKSYLHKKLRKDPELRRWLRKKIVEQLRDESKEDVFTVEFNTSGEVFGLRMNFDTYKKDEDRRQFEKLFQIFLDMPPWEPYYNVEPHKYYVRQRIPVEVLR